MAYPKGLPPVLVEFLSQYGAGDLVFPAGCRGKLKEAAGIVDTNFSKKEVEYAVLTMNPDDWARGSNCNGIYAPYQEKTWALLEHLAAWSHSNAGEKWAVILFVDGMDAINRLRDSDARMNLNWLRDYGPRNRVHVILAP